MARIATDVEDLSIYNQEIEEIVLTLQTIQGNECLTAEEKHNETCSLLIEMKEYTQPLVDKVNALSDNDKNLILHRMARLFPETVQKEIKSCQKNKQPQSEGSALSESEAQLQINEHLQSLGCTDLKTLINTFNVNQCRPDSFSRQQQTKPRRLSEKQASNQVEKMLNHWKKEKELNEVETMQKLQEDKKNKVIQCKNKKRGTVNKKNPNVKVNNSEKVMLMMGIQNAENQEDFEVIFNASKKARSKFL